MTGHVYTENLFSKILLQPTEEECKKLFIVSGYASSAMVFHHAQNLLKREKDFEIHLIVGMTCRDGLSITNHRGFQKLMNHDLAGRFECSYLINTPPTHSKVYSWLDGNNNPSKGFLGSVNYSQQAFIGNNQREVATDCNPQQAYDYYNSLIEQSIYCNHADAEEVIALYQDNRVANSTHVAIESENSEEQHVQIQGLEHVNISLIDRNGEVSSRSGLNWGQRPGREPNQAYIRLVSEIYRTDFFPPIGQHFTVQTDDRKTLICSRAQENGKAIHTPHNNSLIGEYFRFRLNVPNGQLITIEDLEKYGRTDIDFYKIDEENYFLDFSKS